MNTVSVIAKFSNCLVGFLSILFLLFVGEEVSADWKKIRENVNQALPIFNQIDGLSDLFVIDSNDGYVYRRQTLASWTRVGGLGSQFVEGRAASGTTVYALTPTQDAVYQYQGKKGWEKVGGPAKRLYGGYGGLYRISPRDEAIHEFDPGSGKWIRIGGPGVMFAVGGKGELYGIGPAGNGVYRYLGTPNKWQRIGKSAKAIYAAPNHLYRVDLNGNIHEYDGQPFSWTQIGGQGKSFAVSAAGDLYGLSPDGKGIYRYLGSPHQWQKISGEATEAMVAHRDQLYATRGDHSLWSYQRSTRPEDANLLIIAADPALAKAMGDYAQYKRLNGFSVAVVTLDDVLRVTPGFRVADRLHIFLRKVHKGESLRYVMLVGDVDTIPTKVFFRDNGGVEGNRARQNAYTTDFFYANLHTSDWDLDNDGLWGEIKDDRLDIRHDVAVSRLPFNDTATVEKITGNMIAFDQDRGAQWQRRVILAHGFMSTTNDLAGYAEKIDKDLLEPNGFSSEKLYVNKDKTKSKYFDDADAQALDNNTYISSLFSQGQGFALVAAHGATNGMVSVFVNNDGDEDSILFGEWGSVKNQSLAGVFLLNGCNTAPTITDRGYPVTRTLDDELHQQGSAWSSIGKPVHGNIAKEYLKSGAVAVISSTVGSDDGSQVMEYEFARLLADEGVSVGEAFVRAKEKAGPKRDYQSFYLVGDPTLKFK